jgi:hypothetical protein
MRSVCLFVLVLLSVALFADIQFTHDGDITFPQGTPLSTELTSYQGAERLLSFTMASETELDVQIIDEQGGLLDTLLVHWPFPETVAQVGYFDEDGAGCLAVLGKYQIDSTLTISLRILDLNNRLSLGYAEFFPYDNNAINIVSIRDYQLTEFDRPDGHDIFAGWELNTRRIEIYNDQENIITSHQTQLTQLDFTQGVLHIHDSVAGSGRIAETTEHRWLTANNYVYFSHTYGGGNAEFGISLITDSYFDQIILKIPASDDYTGGILDTIDYRMNILSMNSSQPLETFTMLETSTHTPTQIFSERRLTTGEVWCSLESNLHWRDAANEAIVSPPTSCLDGSDGTPMVIYFDQHGQYEIRSRVDGAIVEWGASPFGTPRRVYRLSDGTPVYLSETGTGLAIWSSVMGPVANTEKSIPAVDVVLSQNMPNPFNPETTIAFSLAKEGDVRIDIYNIRGERVRTLLNETRTAGVQSVVWNGCDDAGKTVSSGVYFYCLSTTDKTLAKKMLLLK